MIQTQRAEQQRDVLLGLPSGDEQFDTMPASIRDVVYEWDITTGVLYWSTIMEEVFGHAPEPAGPSLDWSSANIHPDDAVRVIASRQQALDSGASNWECEYRFRRHDGGYADVIDRGHIVRDESGAGVRMIGSMVDVTDRTRADAAVREREERYRAVFEQSRDAVYICTLEGRLVEVNQATVDLLGYSRAELLSMNVRSLYREAAESDRFAEMVRRGFARDVELELRARDGGVRSCLHTCSARVRPDGRVVEYQGIVHDITERKIAEEQLAFGAFHDSLTGLPNRALFLNRLSHAIIRAQRPPRLPFGVLLLDIDRFKVINDSRGHTEGDRVLVAVADRIASAVRAGDTVARLGADEFAVLLEPVDDSRAATQIAERVVEQLAEPFVLGGQQLYMTASAGLAMGSPTAKSAEEIMRNADTALARAKSQGPSNYDIFDDRVHGAALSRLELEMELRHALSRDELFLVYQPIVDANTGLICGLEALVRWRRPDGVVVGPDQFIPIAEETGMIVPIGRWVLREACRYLRNYNDTVGEPELTMSVNLSGKQIAHPGLVQEVAGILREENLSPRQLSLELTESVLIEHSALAGDVFSRLRNLGIELHMDDFGTGYSSLSHLHQFPLDALKIDRSFINRIGEDEKSTVVVRSIVALAKSLGVRVVAEGVESAEQLEGIRKLGCEYAQGFWFSKPCSADDTLKLLSTRPRW